MHTHLHPLLLSAPKPEIDFPIFSTRSLCIYILSAGTKEGSVLGQCSGGGTIHVNECILKQAGGKDERADCPLPNYSYSYL